MDKDYLNNIIEAAITKLKEAQKPLSDLEITAGIVHRLKKKLGEDDRRHSSKGRFRKDSFRDVVNSLEWKKNISQLSDKKFIRKEDEQKYAKPELEDRWTWANISYDKAIEFKLNNLKNIDPFKLEELVSKLLKFIYPEFDFSTTKKTGDNGIDVIGTRQVTTKTKEAIYVQVKGFDGTVGRKYADEFIGALNGVIKNKGYTRLTGLFITTGRYPLSFFEKLKEAQEKNIVYACWDGVELSRQMLKNGLGVKYSLDIDFWKEVDSTAVLESIKPLVKKGSTRSKSIKNTKIKRRKKTKNTSN